jgi:hypothetical protein
MTLIKFVWRLFREGVEEVHVDYHRGSAYQVRWWIPRRKLMRTAKVISVGKKAA